MAEVAHPAIDEAAGGYTPPRPIKPDDDVSGFSCGEETLDTWLKKMAIPSEGTSARSYVVCHAGKVVAFYTLSNGYVMRAKLPSARMRRGMPDPVPVTVLGRLAVDKRHQSKGLGSDLLLDAMKRTLAAAQQVGSFALIVHALDNQSAIRFYVQNDFVPFDGDHIFMLQTATIQKLVDET